jgi:hypothetical protein
LVPFELAGTDIPCARRSRRFVRDVGADGPTARTSTLTIASWRLSCSLIGVTRNLWTRCAKMGHSMRSQSQFCITAVLNEVSDPKRSFDYDRRAVERFNRARRIEIDDTRQRIAQMEAIIADFDRTANELEGWIRAEQNRTRIHDPAHFAYSTFAIAMTRRRDALKRSRETLMRSIDELKRQLADADASLE